MLLHTSRNFCLYPPRLFCACYATPASSCSPALSLPMPTMYRSRLAATYTSIYTRPAASPRSRSPSLQNPSPVLSYFLVLPLDNRLHRMRLDITALQPTRPVALCASRIGPYTVLTRRCHYGLSFPCLHPRIPIPLPISHPVSCLHGPMLYTRCLDVFSFAWQYTSCHPYEDARIPLV